MRAKGGTVNKRTYTMWTWGVCLTSQTPQLTPSTSDTLQLPRCNLKLALYTVNKGRTLFKTNYVKGERTEIKRGSLSSCNSFELMFLCHVQLQGRNQAIGSAAVQVTSVRVLQYIAGGYGPYQVAWMDSAKDKIATFCPSVPLCSMKIAS